MVERPLLILPEPTNAERARRGGGGGGPAPLSRTRQRLRLGPKLTALERAFNAKQLRIQATAAGLVPEDVLVLETAGTVDDFFKAASEIRGLEFLAEYDEDDIQPDEDFFVEKNGVHKEYRGRVYLMFTNFRAFQQLLSLWRTWQSRGKFQHGLAKWRQVFELLRDIRPWSVQDRLEETGVLDDWRDRLEWERENIPCEIELWFRADEQQRMAASVEVRAQVLELGGEVVSEATVPEIHYHALAVRLPITAVQSLLDEDCRGAVALVQAAQIQFFRASGQMAGRITVDQTSPLSTLPNEPLPNPATPPVVALLDGLPLQSHSALTGRLTVDDPDDFGANYEARVRLHGTAMASLIIWGDLHSPGEPIPQPLYVRPIMQPGGGALSTDERVSEGLLIVDLIHRAVRRMFEGEGSTPATAPNVSVINLSIGIADRPFDGTISPLARLLDWLSWKYRVLFLVSAGNCSQAINFEQEWGDLATVSPEEFHQCVTRAIAADTRHRRLLSPAEGVNVLTVGATHEDNDSTALRANWIDPAVIGFPSPINAQGQGYKRSVKPDVLAPGGRVALIKPFANSTTELKIPSVTYGPGQLVATPGPTPGNVNSTVTNRGTSNATALMSRAAALLAPVLDELRERDGGEVLNRVAPALWLKTLLVHGARWGQAGEDYQALLRTPTNGNKLAEHLTRLLGFGRVDLNVVRECTETRVTALAGGRLVANAGAEHRFPLPPSLSGKRGRRCLVVTLTWMTPIHPLNHRWRRAHVWFSSPESRLVVGSNKHLERRDADWQAVQRGTVQHEVFEGEKAAAFVEGDEIVIRVSCREDAPVLSGSVPYTLAVTLEVDPAIGVDIYTEVRERVQTRLRVVADGALPSRS